MGFQPTVYTAVYLSAAFAGAATFAFSWRRRSAPGGRPFLLMLLAASGWCFFDALETSAVGIPAHVLWAQFAFVGNMSVGVFLLLFALEYTRHQRPRPWAVAGLFAVPAVGVVGAATNGWHHLIWTRFDAVPGTSNLVVYSHGLLAWVVAIYALAMVLIAAGVLVPFALRSKGTYRRQSLTVILAVALPWIAEILYIANSRFLPGVDPSVTIVLSGVLMSFGLVRFRLLDLIPIARERLIEHMEDGLIVLDADGRILDSNPAAGRIVGSTREGWVGADVRSVISSWPELADRLLCDSCGLGDTMLLSPTGHTISVSMLSLADAPVGLPGNLVTLRDATGQAKTEAALHSMNADLHERILQVEKLQGELQEQAIRDPLTGLFNRRYLTETLEREIGRAQREEYPVSIVMIDVDNFKRINDEHGHPGGDQVLRFLGAQLRASLRTGDIACRYGGDEFLLVLPNTLVQNAYARAEEWRAEVKSSSVYWMEWTQPTMLSIGVAAFPEHGASGEEVLAAADAALYEAKHAGRDRVVLAHPPTPVDETDAVAG